MQGNVGPQAISFAYTTGNGTMMEIEREQKMPSKERETKKNDP